MLRFWLVIVTLIATLPAFAEVPVTGRVQHMQFTNDQVQTVAAQTYQKELSRLAAQGKLDTDNGTLLRVRHLCSHLIAQAVELKPAAANWPWEVHITSDHQVAAYSMAGGKILVGTRFIESYKLSDNELAVALAHEIGHVIAEHVREQMSQAASFEPEVPNRKVHIVDVLNSMQSDISVYFRLQPLSRLQELEADDIGIQLAARAGVPPSAVVSFYHKLTRNNAAQSVFDTHGPSYQRVQFIQSMANFALPVYRASHGTHLPSYAFTNLMPGLNNSEVIKAMHRQ